MPKKEKELAEFLTPEGKELIELIRNSENPQIALYKAVGIIVDVTKYTPSAYLKG